MVLCCYPASSLTQSDALSQASPQAPSLLWDLYLNHSPWFVLITNILPVKDDVLL